MMIDVIDIVPAQLVNLQKKLRNMPHLRLYQQDSRHINAADASYDCVFMFFLLHEQPDDVRAATLAQAWRIL